MWTLEHITNAIAFLEDPELKEDFVEETLSKQPLYQSERGIIRRLIYSVDEMISETESYKEEFGSKPSIRKKLAKLYARKESLTNLYNYE